MSSSTGNYLEISVTALHIIFFALAVHTVTTGLSDCHSSLIFMLRLFHVQRQPFHINGFWSSLISRYN